MSKRSVKRGGDHTSSQSPLFSFVFFWDQDQYRGYASNSSIECGGYRSRFSMLLLEFGEYFLEDFACELLSFCDILADSPEIIKGRLKLCSRSLVFDPCDSTDSGSSRLRPLMKFPYKAIQSSLQEIPYPSGILESSTFSFTATSFWEMMEDDKVAPYKLIEFSSINGSSPQIDKRFAFTLLHSDLKKFLYNCNKLRDIFMQGKGKSYPSDQLQPLIDSAMRLSMVFNASHLVDFHEQLLLPNPLAVHRIAPLISSPGGLMITDKRIYFQPSQINNTGSATDKLGVQSFPLSQVQRIFRRRYLMRQTAVEFFLSSKQRFLFAFDSQADRDLICDLAERQLPQLGRDLPSSQAARLDLVKQKWQRREISNFEYLMFLNNEADRSCNDLTQYPVRYLWH